MTRLLRPSSRFRKDLFREARGEYRKIVASGGRLDEAIEILALDGELDPRYKDHGMTNLPGVRNCHVTPDLILLYGQDTHGLLDLYRLGTHSELGI